MTELLRHSPLDAEHRALGARMVEFGGWDMPIQYSGVLEEHRACRADAVVFDVSHLGSLRCSGPGARSLLQWAFTNDLNRIEVGRAQYTHLLDPDDAHVVDDIIIWWVGDDDFFVMPNASNTSRIALALTDDDAEDHTEGPVALGDITSERAVLAVQGPNARERIQKVLPEAADVARFGVQSIELDGTACVIAGTGYTGEDGVELHVPSEAAPELWAAILDAGITPAGLGARDTLRLEAGLPLHGHELGEGINPLEAGLGWVVRFDKGDFLGKTALEAAKEAGITRRLRGLLLEGRRPAREGAAVFVDGTAVGEVTSGNFSPTLERAIALAFLPAEVGEGADVEVDIRGSHVAATVVPTPFVKRSETTAG